MASGIWLVPDKSILNLVNATNLLAQATFKCSLHASGWTPNIATMEVFADATNELAGGNGYTAGGATLGSVTLAQTSGTTKFDSADVTWTASGGSIPAWRHAVIRAVGTINGKVDPIVCYFLGDTTPADIPATTDTNTLTIVMNASGIFTAARAP